MLFFNLGDLLESWRAGFSETAASPLDYGRTVFQVGTDA